MEKRGDCGAIHLLVEFVNADRFLVYVNWGAIFCDGLFGRVQTSDVNCRCIVWLSSTSTSREAELPFWSRGEHLPLLRNTDVSVGRVPRTGVRGFRMGLLRNSITTRCPLPPCH